MKVQHILGKKKLNLGGDVWVKEKGTKLLFGSTFGAELKLNSSHFLMHPRYPRHQKILNCMKKNVLNFSLTLKMEPN